MHWRKFIIFIFSFFLICKSYSQDFSISQPRLQVNDDLLAITYDLSARKQSDQFYIWLELNKSDGERIHANAFSGDVGEFQKAGENKTIIWTPGADSIFLDDEISIEIIAEKYVKKYNKGSAIFKSTIFPGWGQSTIAGKPWWLLGVTSYGLFAGSYFTNRASLETYSAYQFEEDITIRQDLYEQAQRQKDIAGTFLLSGATVWLANMVWIVVKPNNYKPLQHFNLSFGNVIQYDTSGMLLTLRVTF